MNTSIIIDLRVVLQAHPNRTSAHDRQQQKLETDHDLSG